MAKTNLTAERLKELLHYDPETGVFTWIKTVKRGGRASVGDTAGSMMLNSRIGIGVEGTLYYAHRLAWLYIYGRWPVTGIDHIDGDPTNNRLCNLREATQAQNNQNRSSIPMKTNKSGFMGVSWEAKRKKWFASIRNNGKTVYLGRHSTPELAHAAYCKAKAAFHDFQPVLRD